MRNNLHVNKLKLSAKGNLTLHLHFVMEVTFS